MFSWEKKFDYLSSCVAGSVAEAATSLNGRRGLRFSLILPPLSISKDQQGILPLVQHPLHRSHPPTFDLSSRTLPNNKDQQRIFRSHPPTSSASEQHIRFFLLRLFVVILYISLILPLVQNSAKHRDQQRTFLSHPPTCSASEQHIRFFLLRLFVVILSISPILPLVQHLTI